MNNRYIKTSKPRHVTGHAHIPAEVIIKRFNPRDEILSDHVAVHIDDDGTAGVMMIRLCRQPRVIHTRYAYTDMTSLARMAATIAAKSKIRLVALIHENHARHTYVYDTRG